MELLLNIFNSIKNEELALLKKDLTIKKDSTYICAKNCINTIFKKILQKLKTDKLNHFIKKNSKVFLNFIENLTDDVFEIITTETSSTNSTEENDSLENTCKEPLLELKIELINQWNNEAIIQSHIKKKERFKQFRVYIISFTITLTGAIIAGMIVNQLNHKNIVQKGAQIIPASVIEKIETSPEIHKEAAYFYKIFKNLDEERIRKFIRNLYLKLS